MSPLTQWAACARWRSWRQRTGASGGSTCSSAPFCWCARWGRGAAAGGGWGERQAQPAGAAHAAQMCQSWQHFCVNTNQPAMNHLPCSLLPCPTSHTPPIPALASCPLQLKAWCYYESRLLGAHHGLISSYALEVLVLHIFNLHHAQLHTPLDVRWAAQGRLQGRGGGAVEGGRGWPCRCLWLLKLRWQLPCLSLNVPGRAPPVCCVSTLPCLVCLVPACSAWAQVLRRFLSVLGSFDWEHYCLALQGPLPLSELHNPHGECLKHCGRRAHVLCFLRCLALPSACLSVCQSACWPRWACM
jgi:hypothetical protein